MPATYARRNWSRTEVELTVASYFDMLDLELRRLPYSKAESRRRLLPLLDNRSHTGVERKHQNISAVLLDWFGIPPIDGYKPLSNYQDLLELVVGEELQRRPQIASLVKVEIDRAPPVPTIDDILTRLVDKPEPIARRQVRRIREARRSNVGPEDYFRREIRNSALGYAGELFILNYERARLLAANLDGLANRVEHVSQSRGDHAGFDVLSYDQSGREKLVEVKTTNFSRYVPFYISRNELELSTERSESYVLTRVFNFSLHAEFFMLAGAVSSHCSLDPTEYVARIA